MKEYTAIVTVVFVAREARIKVKAEGAVDAANKVMDDVLSGYHNAELLAPFNEGAGPSDCEIEEVIVP